jgi:hypothetical protein
MGSTFRAVAMAARRTPAERAAAVLASWHARRIAKEAREGPDRARPRPWNEARRRAREAADRRVLAAKTRGEWRAALAARDALRARRRLPRFDRGDRGPRG